MQATQVNAVAEYSTEAVGMLYLKALCSSEPYS